MTRGEQWVEHPNVNLLRRFYSAVNEGDHKTLDEILDDSYVHHFPGRNTLAGEHRGKSKFFALFKERLERTGGKAQLQLLDVAASDGHGFALLSARYERDGKKLQMLYVNVVKIHEAKLVELRAFPVDQYANDDFWGTYQGTCE